LAWRNRPGSSVISIPPGSDLVFGRTIVNVPANLALMTGEDLLAAPFDCLEVMRIP